MGVLQVIFSHHEPIRPEIQEAFFSTMNRDAGDNEDRHVVGHFYREGRESIWSAVISSEEGEDNHAIAKKIRRIKQALDKMFSQSEWTSQSFESTIKNEMVRYEESIVFGEGASPDKPFFLGKSSNQNIEFITDGYGVATSVLQILGDVVDSPTVSGVLNEGRSPSTQAEILV